MAAIEHTTLISQPGSQSGEPRFKISIPVQTLRGLQSGQVIPMVQASHFLAKTDNGHYQILEIDEAKNVTAILTPTTNITNGLNVSYPSANSTVNTGFNSTILEMLSTINNKTPTIGTGTNTQPSTSTENHPRSDTLGSNINDCIKAIKISMLQLCLLINRRDVSLENLKWATLASTRKIFQLSRDATEYLEISRNIQKEIYKIKRKEYMKRKQENDHTLVEPSKKTNTGESN